MKYTKEEAIRIIIDCAEAYERELEGRSLLLITTDKHKNLGYTELFFYDYNFLHLTGVKHYKGKDVAKLGNPEERNSLSQRFYDSCLLHKLSPSDFEFSEDGTTYLKLEILPFLICKNLTANILGDYNSSKPHLYTEKLAGNVKACMGFVMDEVHNVLVPNTILKEDIRTAIKNNVRVIAVYRKLKDEKAYQEMTYKAKGIDIEALKANEANMWLKNLLTVQKE